MESVYYIGFANCLVSEPLQFINRSFIDSYIDIFIFEEIEVVNVAYLRWNPASLAFLCVYRERSFYSYESKTSYRSIRL